MNNFKYLLSKIKWSYLDYDDILNNKFNGLFNCFKEVFDYCSPLQKHKIENKVNNKNWTSNEIVDRRRILMKMMFYSSTKY